MIAFGLVTLVALVAFSGRLLAQGSPSVSRGAIRPIFGAYVPTGDQRDFLKDAVLAGAQASLNFGSNFAVTGSFGWAPSKDKITAGDQKIDAYQYDVGLEVRTPESYLGGVTPFVGAGVGGRPLLGGLRAERDPGAPHPGLVPEDAGDRRQDDGRRRPRREGAAHLEERACFPLAGDRLFGASPLKGSKLADHDPDEEEEE